LLEGKILKTSYTESVPQGTRTLTTKSNIGTAKSLKNKGCCATSSQKGGCPPMGKGRHSKKADGKQTLGWTIANTIINLLRLFEVENPENILVVSGCGFSTSNCGHFPH
jgi:hypothetical protein